jgi:DNA-binding transcriptional regulator YiaG
MLYKDADQSREMPAEEMKVNRKITKARPKRHGTARAQRASEVDEDVITKDEVARRLKKTARTVENWQRAGRIPVIKVGYTVLYLWSRVLRHLEKHFQVRRKISELRGRRGTGRRTTPHGDHRNGRTNNLGAARRSRKPTLTKTKRSQLWKT